MPKIATLLLLILPCLTAQEVRSSALLDLTKRASQTPTPGAVGHGWAHGVPPLSEGRVPLALPLRIRILQVEPERGQFSLGDTLTCDVVLENISTKPITIPWSSGQVARPETEREAAVAGYQDANLGFLVMDRGGRPHVLDGQLIDGFASRPDTLRTLLPGEAVTIRAKVRLYLQEEGHRAIFSGLLSGTTADIRLVANFFFYPYSYSSGNSENSLPLSLRRPASK